MSGTEYDPSGNSSSSIHVKTDFFCMAFYIFTCIVNAKVW